MTQYDLGVLLLRLAVGVFFAISGYHKLFNPNRHKQLVETLKKNHIPLVWFNQWWVPLVEYVCGFTLAIGFFTVFSATMLGVICCVAALMDGWKRVKKQKPIDPADEIDDVMYLPEVLYLVMLNCIILIGPGKYSFDEWLNIWPY